MSQQEAIAERMQIEIWSDFPCPWCYLGRHRLKAAVDASPYAGSIELVHRSFELDPQASHEPRPVVDALAAKLGMPVAEMRTMEAQMAAMAAGDGLPYELDRLHGNSFDGHRLVRLAASRGLGDELFGKLQDDYFGQGVNIYDRAVLADAAAALGIPREEAERVLAGEDYADEVRAEHAEAAALGAGGVPFTVLDRRLAIPGATSVDGFTRAIDEAWSAVERAA